MKLHMRVLLWVIGSGLLGLVPAAALAEETAAAEEKDAASDRSAAFRAVQGPDSEQVPGGTLLISAYAVVMVLLVGYVGRLGLLQRKTNAEVARLTATIERSRKGS